MKAGTQFFEEYTKVDENMLELRKIVLANKLPRKIEIQPDVLLVGNDERVDYVSFDESYKGIIESQVYHY